MHRLGIVFAVGLATSSVGGCNVASSRPNQQPAPVTVQPARLPASFPLTRPATGAYLPQPSALAAARLGDPMQVTVHTLNNGLTVFLSPMPNMATVHAWTVVRAGSSYAPPHATGLAHYLEHMMFKGTSQLGTTDFAKERPHLDAIESLYAKLLQPQAPLDAIRQQIDAATQQAARYAIPNELALTYAQLGITGTDAYTHRDWTVFKAHVPAPQLAAWATLEAERFRDPQFRLFWPELEAVVEEKNSALDSVLERNYAALAAKLYPDHGYGNSPTLGEIEHLQRPNYQAMVDFFQQYYVPANMAVLLVGDVSPATLPIIERTLGAWQRIGPGTPPLPTIRAVPQAVTVDLAVRGTPLVKLAWQMPAATHPDRLALQVTAALLHYDNQGLLLQSLTTKGAHPGQWLAFHREAGHLEVWASVPPGHTHADVKADLLASIAKLKAGEFTDQEVQRARLAILHELDQQASTPTARLKALTEAYATNLAWSDYTNLRLKAKTLTRDAVIRVANAYLDDRLVTLNNVEGVYTPPVVPKPRITPVPLELKQSRFAQAVLAMPTEGSIQPEELRRGRDFQLLEQYPSGPSFYVNTPARDAFMVRWRFAIGSKRYPALGMALAALAHSGTRELSAEARAHLFQQLGMVTSFESNPHEVTLTLRGRQANLEASLRAYQTWIHDADVMPSALDAARTTISAELAAYKQTSAGLREALSGFAAFGKASMYLQVPSPDRMATITTTEAKEALAALLRHTRLTNYVGKVPPERQALELGPATTAHLATAGERSQRRAPQTNEVWTTNAPTTQASVNLMWRLAASRDHQRDLALAQLAQLYFYSSMAGLMFQEVRETRGLVYLINGYLDPGRLAEDDMAFGVTFETQADKTAEAIATVHEVLTRDIDPLRFAMAKRAVMAQHHSVRTQPFEREAMLSQWYLRGITDDPGRAQRDRLTVLTPSAFQAWLREIVSLPYQLMVVGPAKAVAPQQLRRFGTLTAVTPTDLFSY